MVNDAETQNKFDYKFPFFAAHLFSFYLFSSFNFREDINKVLELLKMVLFGNSRLFRVDDKEFHKAKTTAEHNTHTT